MDKYYLAVDIGASGGRHILGRLENGKLVVEEMYSFNNSMRYEAGHLVWDTKLLFDEICFGLAKCGDAGKAPRSMGVDTWGVDYVLLDKNKDKIGKAYAYRDNRTSGMISELEAIFSPKEMYRHTGMHKMPINSIYQLMAHRKFEPDDMDAAAYFLMLPDYLHFLLTGEITNEYTNATTTQLINVHTKDWDREIISKIGIDHSIFSSLSMPGTRVGELKSDIARSIGFSCDIVLPATHDTASAFAAMPAVGDNSVYISSGTWSLLGCELTEPIVSDASMWMNFTNEGGYDQRIIYLKNIMGLWMIQSVRNELHEELSFEEFSLAAENAGLDVAVDCNDNCFLSPESMIAAIQEYCEIREYSVPKTPGELTAVIYNSLAICYRRTLNELSFLTGKTFDRIHIVGGGSRDRYLNQLTSELSGLSVLAGADNATAIGNIMAQMIADGEFSGLAEARSCEIVSK